MKFALAVLALAFQAGAWAADDLKPQQQRMRACNARADRKGLAAGERNHFLRACLNGANGNGKALTPHQQRSQACSQQARSQRLQGAERRGFMSECEKPRVKQEVADDEKMKACRERARQRRLDADDTSQYVNGCAKGAAGAKANSSRRRLPPA